MKLSRFYRPCLRLASTIRAENLYHKIAELGRCMPSPPRKTQFGTSCSEGSESPNVVISPKTMRYVSSQSGLTPSYLILMGTSGVLAAIAMLTNSIPVLIGSMVIAPALSPLALISLAIVNRRSDLVRKGLVSACCGLALAVVAAMATTWLLNITHVIPKEVNLLNKVLLEERVRVEWYSVITAIAAGIAGMIAVTKRKTDTLVGVVSSLALVPAGAAGAIAFLSNEPAKGFGGMALLGLNATLIVLSGVVISLLLKPNAAKP